MITLNKNGDRWRECNACSSKENVFDLTIGVNPKCTTTIALCKKCLNEISSLNKKMEPVYCNECGRKVPMAKHGDLCLVTTDSGKRCEGVFQNEKV